MAEKTTVQITEDNIEQLNIKVGTILKDKDGMFWKITDFNDFTAGMKVCDKDGNKLQNFVGITEYTIFGGGLSALLNDGVTKYFIETEQQPEVKKDKKDIGYNFFVKDTAEFEQFADFKPITNLTAEEAVKKFAELKEQGFSVGIGLNIPNDIVFDDPEGNGITILVIDENKLANFAIFGDNFIKALNIETQREVLKTRIAAYEDLYEEFVKQNIPCEYPQFVFDKKLSLELSDNSIKKNEGQITSVSLEEILDVMEMKPEVTPDGKIKLYDKQRQEYIDNRYTLSDSDENNWTFSDAAEIFERLDIYINDYYIHYMEEQLEAGGVTLAGNETLKDLCDYAKEQIEAGITSVSQGELNLAMGIVRPDTVIMPEGFIEQEHSVLFDKSGTQVFKAEETGNIIMPTETTLAGWSKETADEQKLAYDYFEIIHEDGVRGGEYVNKVFEKEEKPNLKTYHELNKDDIEGLSEVTQEEFNSIIDALYQQPNPNYRTIPSIIKLPQMNSELAKKISVENANFFMRSEIAHVRPHRKGNYDQSLRIDEMKGMLDFIKTCNTAYIDSDEKHQNFMLAGLDSKDNSRSNKIVFNKDEYGNYIVMVGKVKTEDLNEKQYSKVAVGVEPTIWRSLEENPSATMLRPSTTSLDDLNIAQKAEKSSEPVYFNNLSKEQQKEVIEGYRAADDQEMLETWQDELIDKYIKEHKLNNSDLDNSIIQKETDVAQNPPTDEWIGEYLQKNKVNFNTEYWQDIFAEIEQNTNNQEDVSPEEIEKEKQLIQEKILQQKKELNNPANAQEFAAYPESKQEIQDYIEKLENLSDDDIKNQIIWKKKNLKEKKELRNNVAEQIISENQKKNIPQNGELLSYNEIHPTYTLTNKETKRQTTIQPVGKLSENIKKLGKLNNLSEANNVIEKIKSQGFDILSTESRIVIYNDDKFYDFDSYADSGKFNFETKSFDYDFDSRKLNEWDFKKYIDGGLKITKSMKEFENIPAENEKTTEIPKKFLKNVDEIERAIPENYEPLENLIMEKRLFAVALDYIKEATEENKGMNWYGTHWQNVIEEMAKTRNVSTDEIIDIFYKSYQEINKNAYLKDLAENNESKQSSKNVQKTKAVEISEYLKAKENITLKADPDSWENTVTILRGKMLIGNATLKSDGTVDFVSSSNFYDDYKTAKEKISEYCKLEFSKEYESSRPLGKIKLISEEEQLKDYGISAEESHAAKYFVRSTAEFEQFADFEPITNLTGEEAVAKYKELQEKGIHCGIGINIEGDRVFDDKDGNGITVLVRNNEGRDTLNIYGDSFVKNLKELNQHSFNVLAAFDSLYRTAKDAGLDVEDAPYIAEKENEILQKIDRLALEKELTNPALNEKDKATDFVLEKLKSAGIEVVTDEDEFNRILEREQNLQKMAETLTPEEQKRYFKFNSDETNSFKQQVDEWQADKSNVAKLITVGKIPPVMKVLGFPDNPIEIQHSTLSKAMRPIPQGYPNEAQGHALTIDDIYSIPEQLADPVMVFKSRTRNDSYVFFTERKDSQNRTILIPMAVNKHKGRIVINEITSMYGRNNEIDFVKSNIDEDNLIYVDKKRSTEWERSSHVQFVTQRLSNSNAYDLNILTKERLVNFISANSQVEKITPAREQEQNVVEVRHTSSTARQGLSDPAAGISTLNDVSLEGSTPLSQNPKGNTAVAISDVNDNLNISQNADKSIIQKMSLSSDREQVYGFAYDGKIYLNPDFLNSNVAVHEYTHLWDEYTRRTNPELWQKGMNILKNTNYFAEVKNDPNYADIANDDNLVLSEVHARVCGEMAQKILERIAKEDGEITKDKAIDWNKEIDQYIYENFESSRTLNDGREIKSTGYGAFGLVVDVNSIRSWFAQPMKDLMNGKDISLQQEKSTSENIEVEKYSILEQCNKIIDKYTNTHFTEQEQKLVNKYENEESDRHQVLMSLCNMKYIHCTTKDKDGYWEINKGKEISANEARKLMSYDDFASGIDRASFHITAGRTANDGTFVYFNDSEEKRDIKPYELSKENIELLSKYEELGGLKENIPKTVMEQLSKNNNELTADDLKNAKALLPKEQYQVILEYTQGEEGEHFKGILKEISSKAKAIKGKSEILTEDERHPLAFKYTLGNSRFYFSEWNGEDELFGYVVLNGDTQNSEWGYTSLKELKNAGGKDRNGFPVIAEMTFYGLEDTIEKQISVDYPELSEKMGFAPKLNHNEELISEFGKEIFETLQSRKLEQNAYNICCAAQFVIRTMDSSEKKEIFSIMEKCGCKGKNGKTNTEYFLTEVVKAENNTASSIYDRQRLYEKINKSCSSKKVETNKGIHSPESDYDMEI